MQISQRLPGVSALSPELVFVLLVLWLSFGAVALGAAAGWPGAPNHCVGSADCYCEAARPGPVAQPANTWSLLPFSAVGIGIALHSARARRRSAASNANRMTRTLLYPTLYSGILAFMGPGGILFHASLTNWGGAVDVLSMFLWIDFLIAYELATLYAWRPGRFLAVYLGGTALLMLPRLVAGPVGVPLFAVVFAAWLFLELAIVSGVRLPGARLPCKRDARWLFAYTALSGTAFAIWGLSQSGGPLCEPASLWQGHAVWHVLNAAAFLLLYPYLCSERGDAARFAPSRVAA